MAVRRLLPVGGVRSAPRRPPGLFGRILKGGRYSAQHLIAEAAGVSLGYSICRPPGERCGSCARLSVRKAFLARSRRARRSLLTRGIGKRSAMSTTEPLQQRAPNAQRAAFRRLIRPISTRCHVPRAISAWRGGRDPPFHRGNQRRLRQLASCSRHPLRLSSVEPLSPSLDAPRARRGALRFGRTFCAARGGRPAPSGPAVSAFECRAAVLIGSSCKLGGAPRCPTQTEERRPPISLRTYRSGARRRSVGQ